MIDRRYLQYGFVPRPLCLFFLVLFFFPTVSTENITIINTGIFYASYTTRIEKKNNCVISTHWLKSLNAPHGEYTTRGFILSSVGHGALFHLQQCEHAQIPGNESAHTVYDTTCADQTSKWPLLHTLTARGRNRVSRLNDKSVKSGLSRNPTAMQLSLP